MTVPVSMLWISFAISAVVLPNALSSREIDCEISQMAVRVMGRQLSVEMRGRYA